MAQTCGQLDFAQKAIATNGGGDVVTQHLDGDVTIMLDACARYTVAMPPLPSSRETR